MKQPIHLNIAAGIYHQARAQDWNLSQMFEDLLIARLHYQESDRDQVEKQIKELEQKIENDNIELISLHQHLKKLNDDDEQREKDEAQIRLNTYKAAGVLEEIDASL